MSMKGKGEKAEQGRVWPDDAGAHHPFCHTRKEPADRVESIGGFVVYKQFCSCAGSRRYYHGRRFGGSLYGSPPRSDPSFPSGRWRYIAVQKAAGSVEEFREELFVAAYKIGFDKIDDDDPRILRCFEHGLSVAGTLERYIGEAGLPTAFERRLGRQMGLGTSLSSWLNNEDERRYLHSRMSPAQREEVLAEVAARAEQKRLQAASDELHVLPLVLEDWSEYDHEVSARRLTANEEVGTSIYRDASIDDWIVARDRRVEEEALAAREHAKKPWILRWFS